MAKKWIIGLVVLAAIAGLGALAVSNISPPEEPDADELSTSTPPVSLVDPVETTLMDERAYAATIEAFESAHISGINGTIIDAVKVREGDRVEAGQLVVEMYDSDLRQAQVEERTARAELERTRRLVEVGSMAGQQLEQVEAQYETAQSTVEMLRRNTRLISPIDGVVTDRYFVAGEQFVPGAEAPAIVTIQQIDPLKVTIDVSERYYRTIEEGMDATIELTAHGDRQFTGVVDRIHPTVDPTSRTFRVDIIVENTDSELSPGMSGQVTLKMGEIEGVFLPRSAVRSDPGSDDYFVYTVDDDDIAHRVDVEVGARIKQYRHVTEGLSGDDRVVIEGVSGISDNSAVQVIDESAIDDSAVDEIPTD